MTVRQKLNQIRQDHPYATVTHDFYTDTISAWIADDDDTLDTPFVVKGDYADFIAFEVPAWEGRDDVDDILLSVDYND